jgi:hypothetical protein
MEVRRYLKHCTPGTFLEIGANDPVLLSQTRHLAQLGWTGVLVEPIPELADRLRLERPDSRVVQAVCSRLQPSAISRHHDATCSARHGTCHRDGAIRRQARRACS